MIEIVNKSALKIKKTNRFTRSLFGFLTELDGLAYAANQAGNEP